jgi:hypothetical protein
MLIDTAPAQRKIRGPNIRGKGPATKMNADSVSTMAKMFSGACLLDVALEEQAHYIQATLDASVPMSRR